VSGVGDCVEFRRCCVSEMLPASHRATDCAVLYVAVFAQPSPPCGRALRPSCYGHAGRTARRSPAAAAVRHPSTCACGSRRPRSFVTGLEGWARMVRACAGLRREEAVRRVHYGGRHERHPGRGSERRRDRACSSCAASALRGPTRHSRSGHRVAPTRGAPTARGSGPGMLAPSDRLMAAGKPEMSAISDAGDRQRRGLAQGPAH